MEVVDWCFSMNIATKLVGFQKVLSHWVFFVWSMTSHGSPISVKIWSNGCKVLQSIRNWAAMSQKSCVLSPNFMMVFCRSMTWSVLRNLTMFHSLDALHFVMRVFPNSQSQMQWSLWALLNIIHQLLANWIAFSNEWFQHRVAHGWHIWYWF